MMEEEILESQYEQDEVGLVDETMPAAPSSNGSLSSRMGQRAEVLQRQSSERFPIPGFDGIVDVELRALGHKVESAINHRNERLRACTASRPRLAPGPRARSRHKIPPTHPRSSPTLRKSVAQRRVARRSRRHTPR